MDWRSLSRVSPVGWLGSIMALIVESGLPNRSSSAQKALKRPTLHRAVERLWPNRNRDCWVLLTTILLVTCLPQPIVCSRGELLVQDYAVLRSDPCTTNQQPSPFGGGTSALKLSELVTQSDVIFKAFAGHGNDLRVVVLGNSTGIPLAEASQHRQQQQQYHHQPRWKPQQKVEDGAKRESADFIVRLEPATVYKGNELFKQLQLNSWKHYFILWSNGSVEYTHRDVLPIRGRTNPEQPSVSTTTNRDTSPVKASPSSVDFTTRRSAASGIWSTKSNCTTRRPHQRFLSVRTQPAVAEAKQQKPDSVQPMIDTDGSIDRTTAPSILQPDGPVAFTDEDDHNKPSHTPLPAAGERFNLQYGMGSQQTDRPANEKDFQREGQISHTLSEILPVTLVVFGRLAGSGEDGRDKLLRVDPYVGMLRWDERLEDALWQALGWSEWGDYTSCSVACGGGVQQRFRHCLPSTSTDRAEPTTQFERNASPTETSSFPSTRGNVFSGEIENPTTTVPTTERTQPATYSAPPSVSIATTPRWNGGKLKRKLKSKQMVAGGEKVQKLAFHGEIAVNEKRIMNPATNEPISSESIPHRGRGKFNPPSHESPRLSGRVPIESAHHNRQSYNGADGEGTWPVCEGHNIEQRSCNTFECTGTIDLLAALTPTYQWRTSWDEGIDERVNYEINQLDQNFTLMMSLRLKPVSDDDDQPSSTGRPTSTSVQSGHIFSIRSKLTAGSSLSINFETDGHGGLRVLQEKYGLSEMLPVRSGELTLHDGAWHSLALSGRNNGGFVTVYIDCQWVNSFVLTKGSIELPQYPTVEIGHNVELRQLTVVPGEKSARLQCNSQPVPIHDVENRRVTNYFEHLH